MNDDNIFSFDEIIKTSLSIQYDIKIRNDNYFHNYMFKHTYVLNRLIQEKTKTKLNNYGNI